MSHKREYLTIQADRLKEARFSVPSLAIGIVAVAKRASANVVGRAGGEWPITQLSEEEKVRFSKLDSLLHDVAKWDHLGYGEQEVLKAEFESLLKRKRMYTSILAFPR